jgi:regulator of replication initiation timing
MAEAMKKMSKITDVINDMQDQLNSLINENEHLRKANKDL